MDSSLSSASSESKKLKILFVITKSNWGGAQRYVYDLATALPKDHYDVAVAFGQSGALKDRLDAAGIRTIAIPALERDINIFKEIRSLGALISLFVRERPDIIHLNSSKIGGLGAFAGRLTGVKKIIFTGHGWAFNEDRGSLSRSLILFLHWITIILSHKTIAVCLKIKSQMSWLPFVAKKMVVVHNGVNVSEMERSYLSKDEARNALKIKTEDRNGEATLCIGTISELHKNKGLDFLIEAAAELKKEPDLPPFRFVIIGSGEEKNNLQVLIDQKGLTDSVELKGYVADAYKYLKAFDILTMTSRTEAFPYFVLEAGLTGSPVLASAVGGIPEVIDQTSSGILVRSGNIKEIVTGLSFLMKNPERRTMLGTALKSHIERSFTLRQMVNETEAIYLR